MSLNFSGTFFLEKIFSGAFSRSPLYLFWGGLRFAPPSPKKDAVSIGAKKLVLRVFVFLLPHDFSDSIFRLKTYSRGKLRLN